METTLKFIKVTKNTVVYGNDTIPSVYLPKSIFGATDTYPETVTITISFNKK